MNLYEAVLTTYDEAFAPPEEPVLRISIVGDEAILEIADVTETNDSATYTKIAAIGVDAVKLFDVLALHHPAIRDAAEAKA